MFGIHGMRIVEDVNLTEAGAPITVRRTWRERLGTRPWRPLQATKTIVPQVPYRGALKLDAHTLVMHPAMVQELRRLTEGGS
jgi:hypothetical protein